MAEAERIEIVPPVAAIERIVLTLTLDEARALRSLLGYSAGNTVESSGLGDVWKVLAGFDEETELVEPDWDYVFRITRADKGSCF